MRRSHFVVVLVGLLGAACTGNIADPTLSGAAGDPTRGAGPPGSAPGPGGSQAGPGATGATNATTPGAPGAPPPTPAVPPQATCPPTPLGVPEGSVRLTARQFANSLAVLFPFAVDMGTKFPNTAYVGDYTTFAGASQVVTDDIGNFADTADAVGLQAVAHLAQILPCNPTGNEAACAGQFIDAFAPRAFRRPLLAGERDPLVALYNGLRTGSDALDFGTAIAGVISAVLQSPQFMYQLEIGTPTTTPGVRKLTAYEVATKLSYLYWNAPPDDALMQRAASGALLDPSALSAEAGRLLTDARARDGAWRFFSEWLGFGDQVFDGRVDAALAGDFVEETRRFIGSVVFDSPTGALRELLDNGATQVNSRLAQHYGVAYTGAGPTDWRPITLPAAQKAGVLAKAQVATQDSPVGDTSVVRRGKFINERFLCFELGSPPPGAQQMNPVLPANATARDRANARDKNPVCNTCHTFLDNAGLGMEDIDAIGRARTTYASGTPVDPTGKLIALPTDQDFVGTAALAGKLAGRPEVATCLTRQWYRFATGHRESDAEAQCHVAKMNKTFTDSGLNVRALLASVAGSDAFLYRRDVTQP